MCGSVLRIRSIQKFYSIAEANTVEAVSERANNSGTYGVKLVKGQQIYNSGRDFHWSSPNNKKRLTIPAFAGEESNFCLAKYHWVNDFACKQKLQVK